MSGEILFVTVHDTITVMTARGWWVYWQTESRTVWRQWRYMAVVKNKRVVQYHEAEQVWQTWGNLRKAMLAHPKLDYPKLAR